MIANATHDLQQAEGSGAGSGGFGRLDSQEVNDALVSNSLLRAHVHENNIVGPRRQQRRHDVVCHATQQETFGDIRELSGACRAEFFDLTVRCGIARSNNGVAEDVFEDVVVIKGERLHDGAQSVAVEAA